MITGKRVLAGLAVGFAFWCAPARAEDPAKPQNVTEATIDKIMEQAVRNISRRYNLNDAQTQETDKLMKREVRRFLKEHEKVIWPLIRDLLVYQAGGKPPEDREKIKELGKAARPLAQLAEEAILQANMEWRQFLTEEQLRTHDFDLAEMKKTFSQIDKNFGDWEAGSPTDGPIIPTAEPLASSPPKPKKPSVGLPGPERRLMDPGVFDAIVDKFLKDYDLDQGQIDSARSILVEFKDKAAAFQTANKTQFEEVAGKMSAAMAKRDREQLAEAETARKKLLEPFHELVTEMQTRLDALLTTTQKELRDQRERTVDASTKPGSTPKPVIKPTSVPKSETQPANDPAPSGDEKPKEPDNAPPPSNHPGW